MRDERGSKFFLIRDIERCPYVPSEPEYDSWDRKDAERVNKIVDDRKAVFDAAQYYKDHSDISIRKMAEFIIWFFDRE